MFTTASQQIVSHEGSTRCVARTGICGTYAEFMQSFKEDGGQVSLEVRSAGSTTTRLDRDFGSAVLGVSDTVRTTCQA